MLPAIIYTPIGLEKLKENEEEGGKKKTPKLPITLHNLSLDSRAVLSHS